MIDCFSSSKNSLIMPLLVCKLRKLLPLSSLVSSKTLMILSGKVLESEPNMILANLEILCFNILFCSFTSIVRYIVGMNYIRRWIIHCFEAVRAPPKYFFLKLNVGCLCFRWILTHLSPLSPVQALVYRAHILECIWKVFRKLCLVASCVFFFFNLRDLVIVSLTRRRDY